MTDMNVNGGPEETLGAPAQNQQGMQNQSVQNQQAPQDMAAPDQAQQGGAPQDGGPQGGAQETLGAPAQQQGQSQQAQQGQPMQGMQQQNQQAGAGQGQAAASGTPEANDSNLQRDPDEWATGAEPMTAAQKSYLDTLAKEAGETLPASMTKAEASKHIDRLQGASGRVNDGSAPQG